MRPTGSGSALVLGSGLDAREAVERTLQEICEAIVRNLRVPLASVYLVDESGGDLALYVANNHGRLRDAGSSVVLYLPKIQTAEEAALWRDMLAALESRLGLESGTVKAYVLVEQIEAAFQLLEIRAGAPRQLKRVA